ncbi:hypothetical protein SISNIDRAFT_471266 [Sistotremastrum niveocremeum HHB9708]|uniref:Uncharacterized protein n=1 Tax=Sistotremastrum niveocremeum HHB9708 TaxID=1314777 RepID=A0A164MW06_9AGAM|nr:hypothetical protein SISNIDRAFT_471266 [Sistotremastrum niveocremeum HHB9708]
MLALTMYSEPEIIPIETFGSVLEFERYEDQITTHDGIRQFLGASVGVGVFESRVKLGYGPLGGPNRNQTAVMVNGLLVVIYDVYDKQNTPEGLGKAVDKDLPMLVKASGQGFRGVIFSMGQRHGGDQSGKDPKAYSLTFAIQRLLLHTWWPWYAERGHDFYPSQFNDLWAFWKDEDKRRVEGLVDPLTTRM